MKSYHNAYGNPSHRKAKKRRKRAITFVILLMLLAIGTGTYLVYETFLRPNVWVATGEKGEVFIPTGSTYEQARHILFEKGLIERRTDFERAAHWLKLDEQIKPGHYVIEHGMDNFSLIRLLKSGNQKPIQLTFNNIRDIPQLAGRVSAQIEADSTTLVKLLSDSLFLAQIGYNRYTIPALFIPNTYEFWWTTDAKEFVSKMLSENARFWTDDRLARANATGLNKTEVSVLASIVEKETNKDSEKPAIAGVYLNRLRGGWRLQADPTLVFAAGDFEIRRVLDIHKTIESPYNTYLYPGLPPGPICIPSIASLEAVLNPDKHYYYYFCAKDDMSGYHVFASSYAEHELNAWRFRQALNRLNIRK